MTLPGRLALDAHAFAAAIALLIAWQGLALTVLLKRTRKMWAVLAEQSDALLWRIGTMFLLFALGLAVWSLF